MCIWDRSGCADGHHGQGLLLNIDSEGAYVLTCHHVIASIKAENLSVRLTCENGTLDDPLPARYDETRSNPEKDAAVLRLEGVHVEERPVLHRVGLDTYDGALRATVLTHLTPDNFDAEVRMSTRISMPSAPSEDWPVPSGRYELHALRLSHPTDARPGISGGVVVCEDGVLGLVHFARKEGVAHAREDYLVPLSAWSERWSALDALVEPLVDGNLRAVAIVKKASDLNIGDDLIIAGYRQDVYEERGLEKKAREALAHRGGVVFVGRPKAGKTRLVLELLKQNPNAIVVIPRGNALPPRAFEASGFRREDLVLLFDDLHRIAETAQPVQWHSKLSAVTDGYCRLVCTTRDGTDWKTIRRTQEGLLDSLGWDAATVFASRTGEPGTEKGEDFSKDQGKRLADTLAMSPEEFDRRFDGTPGSLILNLDDMGRRYEALREENLGGVPMSRLLDAAKLLRKGGQESLTDRALRAVSERIRGDGRISADGWEALHRRSQEEGFGHLDADGVFQVYSPYLEQCVSFEPSAEDVDGLLPVLADTEDAVGLIQLAASYGPDTDTSGKSLLCFERALEIDENQPLAWYGKAVTLTAVGRRHEAINAYEETLRLRPDLFEVWVNKAMALNDLERHEDALASSERALELDPRSDQAWLTKGISLVGLGRTQKALQAYDQAIEINPEFPSAWQNRATELVALGRYTEAMQAYDVALLLRPDYGLAYHSKGNTLNNAGHHEEALECFELALRYGSGYAHEDLRGKGQALGGLGRYEEALRVFDQALELEPGFAETWHSKGVALDESGHHKKALEAIDQAIALEPDLAVAQHGRGVVLANLERWQEALAAFDKTLEMEGCPSKATLLAKAAVLHRMRRHRDALQVVQTLIQLHPRLPRPWYLKSELLEEMGYYRESENAYRMAVWLTSL